MRPGSFSDWQLRAIAATGGVVGMALDSDLIGDGKRAELADVLRQVSHVTRVAGPDAVAFASGFETGIIPPLGLSSGARFPRLAGELIAKSMPDERKLFRENALRVLCASTPPRRAGRDHGRAREARYPHHARRGWRLHGLRLVSVGEARSE